MNSSSVPTKAASPPGREPVELPAQDGARRLDHGTTVGPTRTPPRQIGHHQGGAGQPGQQSQGAEIGRHDHIAVAGLPAGDGVPVDGVHVHVDGKQVVATFGAVGGDVLDEQPGRHPFAGEAALHVGERDDDGVDLTVGDETFEFDLRQHDVLSTTRSQPLPPCE